MLKSPTQYIMQFDSLAEIGQYCIDKRIGHTSGDRDWYGGASLEDATRMCIQGDVSQVAAAQELIAKFPNEIETLQYEDLPSVAGCYPCVPEALAGEPECMREPHAVGSDSAPLKILVDLTVSSGISAGHLKKRGTAVLALVMALSASRPVELDVMYIGGSRNAHPGDASGLLFNLVTVRINTTPLDLASAAYALTHAGFVRRIVFGIARIQDWTGQWVKFPSVPFQQPEHPGYIEYIRLLLGITEETLYIPPTIYGREKMIVNPVGWVRDQLVKYSAQELI